MKTGFALTIVISLGLIAFGSPLGGANPVRAHYYESPTPILPMTFAHMDHVSVNCIDCHHNYVDDTGGSNCMSCHVTNPDVWPLFEEQFHALCRECHTKLSALGENGGPPRQCKARHLGDTAP